MQNPPPPPPPPGGYSPPPPPPQMPGAAYPVQGYAAQGTYGGFWIRFVAYIIDSIIVFIPIVVLAVIVGAMTGAALGLSSNANNQNASGSAISAASVLVDLIALVFEVGYFVYFWSTGGTLGMKLFKLRVADANTGQPIGMGRALLRYVGFIISAIPCDIGLIWAGFDARKQGWHDKIASTVVLQG